MNILVLDIGGTLIKTGICDENGHLTQMKEYPTELQNGEKNIIDKLNNIITGFHDYEAIGVSIAGCVDSEEGYIYSSGNIPDLNGLRLKDVLEKKFCVPVKIENDVNAAALGEKYYGAGKGFNDFLCLTIGTGIGGAIVIDSTIFKGHKGIAAEFGHMITHPRGARCSCGGSGCYETYASATALVKNARKINQKYFNGRIIFAEDNQQDKELERVIHDWVYEVALGLTSLIHIFNPPAIILGGGIMEQEKLVHMISAKVKELALESFSDVKILKASLGNKAGMYGAAQLILNGEYYKSGRNIT
ncbi:ROK family protein [Cytobacillus depressus]|uniref:ROK family protein n=1 Tax=Cytobacillus depressus TaxID=1602942 RepID=A0A6L3V7M8_9BACI|nr:ROK family protein [Cytobacillus depressus]KAB2336336.1 ROK family protein [Cytobacillus depressus]